MQTPAFERTCVACRARAHRSSLRRFVHRDSSILEDLEQNLPGRGAYLCSAHTPDDQRAALRRALRAPSTSTLRIPVTSG